MLRFWVFMVVLSFRAFGATGVVTIDAAVQQMYNFDFRPATRFWINASPPTNRSRCPMRSARPPISFTKWTGWGYWKASFWWMTTAS